MTRQEIMEMVYNLKDDICWVEDTKECIYINLNDLQEYENQKAVKDFLENLKNKAIEIDEMCENYYKFDGFWVEINFASKEM